ncbi:MAG: hypothetical protein M1831_002280 [Alyxoria varia]|nr:MAG: hypothetical protein M1831_002280 [Alyxoria varia]
MNHTGQRQSPTGQRQNGMPEEIARHCCATNTHVANAFGSLSSQDKRINATPHLPDPPIDTSSSLSQPKLPSAKRSQVEEWLRETYIVKPEGQVNSTSAVTSLDSFVQEDTTPPSRTQSLSRAESPQDWPADRLEDVATAWHERMHLLPTRLRTLCQSAPPDCTWPDKPRKSVETPGSSERTNYVPSRPTIVRSTPKSTLNPEAPQFMFTPEGGILY